MSHLSISELKKNISYIKKKTNCPICIDTEGAQIRSKYKKRKLLDRDSIIEIGKDENKSLNLYPDYINEKLKLNDTLNIGFEGLRIKVIKKKSWKDICKSFE